MKHLAIFASGGGSNAECIIQHFSAHPSIAVSLIVSNKATAGVIQKAENHQLPYTVISKAELNEPKYLLPLLQKYNVDFIALAGFLLLIPQSLVQAYPDAIFNIHPALLPKYGGKGMYGHHVHQAVFDDFEKESGPTIHLVNEKYDEGKILFQKSVALLPSDTPDVIAKKVLAVEHEHYARVIEEYILS